MKLSHSNPVSQGDRHTQLPATAGWGGKGQTPPPKPEGLQAGPLDV